MIAYLTLQIFMILYVHRLDFYCMFKSVHRKRLDGNDRNIRADIKNQKFVQKFSSELAIYFSKRDKKIYKFIAERMDQTVIFCMFFSRAIRESYLYVV